MDTFHIWLNNSAQVLYCGIRFVLRKKVRNIVFDHSCNRNIELIQKISFIHIQYRDALRSIIDDSSTKLMLDRDGRLKFL